MEINQTEFKNRLRKSKVFVKFTKVNGELREMNATLNPSLIPPLTESETVDANLKDSSLNKTKRTIRKNDSVCNVYDLDNNGWRSFRWDSIVEYSYME